MQRYLEFIQICIYYLLNVFHIIIYFLLIIECKGDQFFKWENVAP